jgi:hypothetical protein
MTLTSYLALHPTASPRANETVIAMRHDSKIGRDKESSEVSALLTVLALLAAAAFAKVGAATQFFHIAYSHAAGFL